jgi:enoyl-CoA hydratase/carnithine racemase
MIGRPGTFEGTDPMTDHVVSAEDGGILAIVLNRPDKKNALTAAMYASLADALTAADRNPDIRVVTITGTGDSFTSGNDVADFVRQDASIGGDQPVARFLRAVSSIETPLIAAVNGVAVGVGVTMLLHCDLAYAATSATFQLPFVNLGLVPEAASTLLLPQMAGHHRAAELLLLGERFDAGRALALGLVNAVVPDGELAALVAARAAALAAKPPGAVRATKALMKRAAESVPARMAAESADFARLLQSPEAQAIMQAFLSRRKPG